MLIVKYAGANTEMANGTGWTIFLAGMEGLLIEEKDGVQVLWREILIKPRATEPWRLCQYMPASVEFSKLVVTGYADEVVAWKQSHVSPPIAWPPWLKDRAADLPDRTTRRDK